MNRQELEAVIRRVVEQYQDNLTGSGDLSFPVEASANHVHLTREDAVWGGDGADLRSAAVPAG